MSVADLLLAVFVTLSIVLIVASLPAAGYCVWVYGHRISDSDVLHRLVRWIVAGTFLSALLLVVALLLPLSLMFPGIFAPLPRPWGSIILLMALDAFPLFVINTARTWRRMRREGRDPNAPKGRDKQ